MVCEFRSELRAYFFYQKHVIWSIAIQLKTFLKPYNHHGEQRINCSRIS